MRKSVILFPLLTLLAFSSLGSNSSFYKTLADDNEESFNSENFLNPNNYKVDSTSTISSTDNGLKVIGGATYQLPFTFKENEEHKIKFKFNIDQMDAGQYAYVIFHNNPDNVFMDAESDISGLYCRIASFGSNKYSFETFYTDEVNYKLEPIAGALTYNNSVIRDHTIQLETSLIQGYTNGIRLFYDGVHFGDWLGYSMVKNRNLTDEYSNIYVSVVGNLTITNILPNDVEAPKITIKEDENNTHYANEEFVIDSIETIDDVDGNVPYTYKLLNPSNKDITHNTYINDNGKIAFVPIESGDYIFRVSASDYSYNTNSKRFNISIINRPHYPVFVGEPPFSIIARRSSKYYFPEGNARDIELENPDNNMTYAYSGYFYDNSNAKHEIEIKQDNNGYYFEPLDYEPYRDLDGTGKYYLSISATNSYGTTYFEKEIWVKYDLTGSDAYLNSNLCNKSNWALNKINKFENNKVYIAGTTFYKAGLLLENGVKINFSILDMVSNNGEDKWFSLSLLKHPGNARYGNPNNDCGLYFMFFERNNNLLMNIQYIYSDGTYRDITNSTVIYSEIPEDITLEVTPFDTSLDASMDDNISIFLDGSQVESFEISKIYRSDMADDEGFVYLAAGYNNLKDNQAKTFEESNNPKFTINSILNTDKTAPEISLLGDFPVSSKGSKEIILPEAKGIDETDGEIAAQLLRVKDPNGKSITVINNKFIPKKNGTYIVIYSASDTSGNTSLLEKTIEVSGVKENGCKGSIDSCVYLLPISILVVSILLIKRKNEQ